MAIDNHPEERFEDAPVAAACFDLRRRVLESRGAFRSLDSFREALHDECCAEHLSASEIAFEDGGVGSVVVNDVLGEAVREHLLVSGDQYRARLQETSPEGPPLAIFELQCGDDGSPVSAYPVAAFASEAEARRIDDFVRRRIKGYGPAQRPALWVPFEDLR